MMIQFFYAKWHKNENGQTWGSRSYGSVLDPKERGAYPLSKSCRA
jgi:hypothetical protein